MTAVLHIHWQSVTPKHGANDDNSDDNDNGNEGATQIYQLSKSHLKILSARRVTRSKTSRHSKEFSRHSDLLPGICLLLITLLLLLLLLLLTMMMMMIIIIIIIIIIIEIQRMYNVKTKVIPVILGATGAISK
jgi:hypothetical protein